MAAVHFLRKIFPGRQIRNVAIVVGVLLAMVEGRSVAEEHGSHTAGKMIQASAVIGRSEARLASGRINANLADKSEQRTGRDADKSLRSSESVWPNASRHRQNMVATVAPQATDAGLDALRNGGNAVDAAVAACLTLGVVDGYNSGIGGGCFILIRTADGGLHAIDGRETAPAAADRDFYRKDDGSYDSFASQTGPRAVAVPGALKAFEEVIAKFGELDFADLILPAAKIAEEGFRISQLYSEQLERSLAELQLFPETASILLTEDRQALPPDTLLRQPDLAETYRQIAEHGSKWFYEGPFAQRVSQWMANNGGCLTASDFAAYQTVNRKPVRTDYRGHEIVGFPLPSSGGLHVAQILNMLESFPLAEIERRDPIQATHIVAEAMKLAFADRAYWPGDPAFVGVPRSLVSQAYADQQAELINPRQAMLVATHGQPPNPDEVFVDRHTTHVAAADNAGNWVAITSTINTHFGSKVIVPGTGVILNNEMDDFSIAPGVPNAFDLIGNDNNSVAAGKRPLSSMSPTIVLKDGHPVMTVGAAGGPKIITQAVWSLINTIDFGLSPAESLARPKVHHQWSPDMLRVEDTMSQQNQNRLRALGHELFLAPSHAMGVCQMIRFDPASGYFHGAYDPRVPGKAAGVKVASRDSNKATFRTMTK